MKKVGIVMGSASDLPIVKKAIDTLVSLDIPHEVHVYSAHRTPDEAAEFAANARKNGFGAIIAAAGMAAHLAGAIAALFALLIGLPVLRLKSDYLAIATLGFAEIIRAVFQWSKLGPVTNGSNLLKSFLRNIEPVCRILAITAPGGHSGRLCNAFFLKPLSDARQVVLVNELLVERKRL